MTREQPGQSLKDRETKERPRDRTHLDRLASALMSH